MLSRSRLWFAPAVDDVVAAFRVLGLLYNPRAPPANRPGVDEVRRQYREMARLHHPDLRSGDDNKMKVINTAYELIQSSGVLQGAFDGTTAASPSVSTAGKGSSTRQPSRFAKKAGGRRRRVPDDFANGDDSSWSLKSSLDWQSMMNSSETLTEEEMNNPANHPFSHSRFFSFDDDVTIYKMVRGGATVRQVARTLGKSPTFVEKRLQNAQFKMRVQYVLRHAKKSQSAPKTQRDGGSEEGSGPSTSTPVAEAMTRRVLRRSPYEGVVEGGLDLSRHRASSSPDPSPDRIKREWEASYPDWRTMRHWDSMSLEEKGRRDGILTGEGGASQGHDRGPTSTKGRGAASKMGRSYANYQRMHRGRK